MNPEKAIALTGNAPVAGVPLIDLPLTSQLRYRASSVSRFLADHLPDTQRARGVGPRPRMGHTALPCEITADEAGSCLIARSRPR